MLEQLTDIYKLYWEINNLAHEYLAEIKGKASTQKPIDELYRTVVCMAGDIAESQLATLSISSTICTSCSMIKARASIRAISRYLAIEKDISLDHKERLEAIERSFVEIRSVLKSIIPANQDSESCYFIVNALIAKSKK